MTDEPPRVTLWHGSGEHGFAKAGIDPGEMPDSFRKWIKEAAS
jgi:hypothetical protein